MLSSLKRKPSPPIDPAIDQWVIAEHEEEGLPIILRFRAEAPDIDLPSYPVLINIYWRYEPGRDQGMPGSADYYRMVALEELLEPAEAQGTGFQVLSITGNSRREWAWYVKSDQAFLAALNNLLAGQEQFPIEIEAASDPDWSNYRALLGTVQKSPTSI